LCRAEIRLKCSSPDLSYSRTFFREISRRRFEEVQGASGVAARESRRERQRVVGQPDARPAESPIPVGQRPAENPDDALHR
jgi:hypothetical protein